MKAVVCPQYGSPEVLRLEDVPTPTPSDDEVLVQVHAASVTAADSMMRRGIPFYARFFLGLTKPKQPIPGTGFAGEVVSVGEDVSRFKPGDAVFGETGVQFGAQAEYVCVPADGVVAPLPHTMSYAEAAPVCDGALTSWSFLKALADLHPGQRVLVNGASGSLGTAAVQLATHVGAEVTGVCSTSNLDLVRSLGADAVVDYTQTDFTETDRPYDVIYDTVGKRSFSECKNALTKTGLYLSPVLRIPLLLQMLWTASVGGKKAVFSATGMRPPEALRTLLQELTDLIESGAIRSVMDRHYPLDQATEAHRYVDRGHKTGNVVLTMPCADRPDLNPPE